MYEGECLCTTTIYSASSNSSIPPVPLVSRSRLPSILTPINGILNIVAASKVVNRQGVG